MELPVAHSLLLVLFLQHGNLFQTFCALKVVHLDKDTDKYFRGVWVCVGGGGGGGGGGGVSEQVFCCYLLFLSFKLRSFLFLFLLHLFQLLCQEFISVHPLQVLLVCWGVCCVWWRGGGGGSVCVVCVCVQCVCAVCVCVCAVCVCSVCAVCVCAVCVCAVCVCVQCVCVCSVCAVCVCVQCVCVQCVCVCSVCVQCVCVSCVCVCVCVVCICVCFTPCSDNMPIAPVRKPTHLCGDISKHTCPNRRLLEGFELVLS